MSEKNKQFGITVAIVLGAFAFVTFVAALYEGKIPIPEMFTNQFWVVLTGILIGIGGAATARLSNRNADRTQQVMRDSTVRVEKAVHDAKNEIQYEFYNGGAKNIAQQAAQETKTEVVSALAPLVLGGERRTEDEASDTGARRRAEDS